MDEYKEQSLLNEIRDELRELGLMPAAGGNPKRDERPDPVEVLG